MEFTPIFYSVNSFDCWYGWQNTIFGAKLYSNNTDILLSKISKLFTEWKMGKPNMSDLKANQADELAHSSFAFPLVPNTYCCFILSRSPAFFKQLSELFIVAISFYFCLWKRRRFFCALLSCKMDESEVEKSCVKPEENQPTFIFDGGFCQIGVATTTTKTKKKKKTKGSRGRQHMSTFRSFQLFDSIPPKQKFFITLSKKRMDIYLE